MTGSGGTEKKGRLRSKKKRGGGGGTHPIVIKHAPLNLVQNIPRRIFKRPFHVLSRSRARFDEQEAFLFGPQRGFFRRDLALFVRDGGDDGGKGGGSAIGGVTEIDLVADENTGEVWICVFSHVREPSTCVHETCVWRGG